MAVEPDQVIDDDADISVPKEAKFGIGALVVVLHVLAIIGLIRAFAPDFSAQVVEQVVSTFNVTITAPEPTPSPTASNKAGTAAEIGKKATPKEVAAKKPKLAIASPSPVPAVAAKGADDSAGAANSGPGTGAGGQGSGRGSGNGGDGTGGGKATKFVQIAGTIDSARDYPKDTRDLRIGKEVVIMFTIGTDGRVRNCRVRDPSGDPQSDAITCKLAEQRFRFKPSTDASGNPIEAQYGWRQRWFYPKSGK